ncbi:MAG: hypothetical protein PVJ84_15515, partial [Desulfobacteraceae bacterium]
AKEIDFLSPIVLAKFSDYVRLPEGLSHNPFSLSDDPDLLVGGKSPVPFTGDRAFFCGLYRTVKGPLLLSCDKL